MDADATHPHRSQMRLEKIFVREVESRPRYATRDHPGAIAEEILIVRVPLAGEGQNQCRLTATACAPAALCVVRWCRRDVPQMDSIQVVNVDPQFHRRRTAKDREC